MRFLPLALLCLFVTGSLRAEPPAIAIKIRGGKIGHVPHVIRVSASVLPDEHNRRICIEWSAPSASGKGCEDIDGLAGRLTYWRDITLRASGTYSVRAILDRDDNKIKVSNIEQVRVIGFGEEIEDGSDTANP